MILLAAASIAVGAVPVEADRAILCDVGRAALRDLPAINGNPRFDAYYAGTDAKHHDLLDLCPMLKTALPRGYPLADDDARKRASVHAPILGRQTREAFIYSIDIPELAADHNSAVVHMGYTCSGLCGAAFEARYIRTAKGWKREGAIRNLYVS